MSLGPDLGRLTTDPQEGMLFWESLLAFHAGVVVCLPAGNDRPELRTVAYGMPWVITVGACSVGKIMATRIEVAMKEKGRFQLVDQFDDISLNLHDDTGFHRLSLRTNLESKDCVLCLTAKGWLYLLLMMLKMHI